MKIMRFESWRRHWCAAPSGETMQCGMRRVVSLRRSTGLRVIHFLRRLRMQWTTPTASDFRFGFEITMYVSAR